MRSIINTIRRWFGYEKVAVIKAKKNGPMYDQDTEIEVSNEYRSYYRVNFKNLLWNAKNYIKYKLNLEHRKDKEGKVYYRWVYTHKQFTRKKHDFAIIRKHLIKYAVENPIHHFGETKKK